jgi:glycosyltransferase involved in cell wall biosynthesis
MPGHEERSKAETSAGGKYRVGSLGYYFRMKRYSSIISAWSAFQVCRAPDVPCELLLGGDVPRREKRRLLRLCDPRFTHTIDFVGFLTEEELHRTMRSLDLAVALRFPSNGETSGVIAHYLAYNTPVVVSDFAAFREEPAAFRISVSPEDEIPQLAAALEEGFDAWSRGFRLVNKRPAWCRRKGDLARCLLEILG